MQVLVLAQYFPPDIGGASTRVSNVVKGLLSRGCKVTVVAAFPHYPLGIVPMKYRGKPIVSEQAGSAKVLRVWVPSLPHNSILNRIVLHLCFIASSLFALPFVGRTDVIWAANPNLFCFFSALVYGFAYRKPIVRNVDDLWPEVFYELGLVRPAWMQKLLNSLAWFSYAVPAAITPISMGYKSRIVKGYGIPSEKIHVVEVGVDKAILPRIDQHKKDQFVFMYSGVLGLGYDFDVVLRAAEILNESKNVIFVIRGVGELASKLRRRIRELNLTNVILDASFLSTDKLSQLLASADVFVLPMTSASIVNDGLPAKVFEYQSYGKPIICVSSGEPARYVETTKSGLVVKPRDATGLSKAVLTLCRDRRLAAELGHNGWQHVSENMTSEKTGERMWKVLTHIGK
jgi:glycosyltransferase involved in cell wall biosynthesis